MRKVLFSYILAIMAMAIMATGVAEAGNGKPIESGSKTVIQYANFYALAEEKSDCLQSLINVSAERRFGEYVSTQIFVSIIRINICKEKVISVTYGNTSGNIFVLTGGKFSTGKVTIPAEKYEGKNDPLDTTITVELSMVTGPVKRKEHLSYKDKRIDGGVCNLKNFSSDDNWKEASVTYLELETSDTYYPVLESFATIGTITNMVGLTQIDC